MKFPKVLFLLSLCVHSSVQEYPHVSFLGNILANHSYVNLSLVSVSGTVQCHTDLNTCCSGEQGPHRGDWYFPDGERLPFPGDGDIYENRSARVVHIHRNKVHSKSIEGIYCCNIVTISCNADDSCASDRVYVGLYNEGGMFK